MVRGPSASHAARKLPGPESSRFVTRKTFPPRPPGVLAPKPSAPGNAGRSAEADSAAKESGRASERKPLKAEARSEQRVFIAKVTKGESGQGRVGAAVES